MKVVSLNTWGGKAGTDGLLAFLKRHDDVDIFCLQEVFDGGEEMRGRPAGRFALENFDPKLFERIGRALPGYKAHFRPQLRDFFGLALFAREEIPIAEEGEVYIYREKGHVPSGNIADHSRTLQYVTLDEPKCSVMHVHGLWNGKGKLDCDERIEQSARILSFLRGQDRPFVLLGDFNLRPDTESIRMLEDAGLRNLIREHGIETARTSLYDSREKEPHANYAFVSEDIDVKEFKVLPDEVSDHAPLYLEFSV